MELSIIIVSWNVRDYLRNCLASVIKHTTGIDYEVIVVDNDSSDNSAEMVEKEFPHVRLIRSPENIGFARGNNLGYEHAQAEFILLLNPDTEVKPGSIQTVLEFMKQEKTAGIAGCRNVGEDGGLQKSIFPFPSVSRNLAQAFLLDRLLYSDRKNGIYYRPRPFPVDCVGGAFMMVRRTAIGNGTLLNPDYFMYSEEKDLALRLKRNGWATWFVPMAEIVHYGEKSAGRCALPMFKALHKSQIIFFRTFHSLPYAFMLCLSWWMVLCSTALFSLPFAFSLKGRARLVLFFHVARSFPAMAISELKYRKQ